MKRLCLLVVWMFLIFGLSCVAACAEEASSEGVPMYRLYHPRTHEHLFTADANEKEVLSSNGSWLYEGVGWIAPVSGDPVYRLFNPGTTDHLYTKDANEYWTLALRGWNPEGIAFYSVPGEKGLPVYRQFTPSLVTGSHFFTVFPEEHTALIDSGSWKDEGVAWRAMSSGALVPVEYPLETVHSPEMEKAIAYVDRVTTPSMSREEKLRACFDSFAALKEKNPWIPHYTGPDWPQRYANSLFDTLSGNCISYAAAFAYMARAIGYEEVYACNSGGHGWAEIDGLVYDPEWALHNHDLSYFGITYFERTGPNYWGVVSSGRANVRVRIED